jgi:hypothetical protein
LKIIPAMFTNPWQIFGSRWGSYFDGGCHVIFFILSIVGAAYSWFRLWIMLAAVMRVRISKRNKSL